MNALIWDFDGTLGQRKGAWSGALVEVLERKGYPGDRERLRPFIQSGFPWHTPEHVRPPQEPPDLWWQRLEPIFAHAYESGAGLRSDAARRLAAEVRAAYIAPDRWELFDDSFEVLTELSHRGWRHYLLSNHVPELSDILKSLGISAFFDMIFNSAETGVEKPNALAFQNILSKLPPERTVWMIGDSMTADVLGAEAQRIPAVLARAHHPDAHRRCGGLTELLTMLSTHG
jgi:putative hydrolase of the HAD superfamily